MMDFGLADKVVIVTGATANIGRAIALDFAAERAKVVVVGRDEAAAARLIELARTRGAGAIVFVKADMLDPLSAARILARAEELGPVEVLINNVGGGASVGLFATTDQDAWQADVDRSLMTTLRMTRVVLPGMIARKYGRIINIGSAAALGGQYAMATYSAAKGAVHSFTQALAREVGEYNVTVNCVAPHGTMSSDPAAFSTGSNFHPEFGRNLKVQTQFTPEQNAKRRRIGQLPRQIAQPEEVAAAVLWLASSRGAYVTGQIVSIDGGALL
jgi:NAD(P)-dependent dehydrogenase (short-subunit alcohol dehydrogenase family)